MKAVFRKEWYCITAYLRNFAIMVVLIAAIVLVLKTGITMVPLMMLLYLTMIPLTTFHLDENAKWDGLAVALPIGRDTIVAGRYLFFLLVAVVISALTFLFSAALAPLAGETGWMGQVAASCVGGVGTFLLVSAVTFPLVYRFGAEKARYVLMLLFFAAYMGMVFAIQNLVLPAAAAVNVPLVLAGMLALGLVLYAVSFLVARGIYRRKEF